LKSPPGRGHKNATPTTRSELLFTVGKEIR
jgi:hypothetical protein